MGEIRDFGDIWGIFWGFLGDILVIYGYLGIFWGYFMDLG
jgi:hypothetical protein